MDVPIARQAERPAWLNARTILGSLLMVVAVVGGQRILADARTTVAYWSAARDLPTGAELQPEDLLVTEVRLPAGTADRYLSATAELGGATLERAVTAGELIPAAWLSAGAAAVPLREMTIPVPPEHAVGGSLVIGDIVDVYATFRAEGAGARTTLVARSVEILGVVEAGGLVLDEESKIGITVAVSPEEATRLAFAIRTSELDVVRVVGPPGRTPARDVQEGDL